MEHPYKTNMYQAILTVVAFALLLLGMSLMNGCSQEMGSRYEMEWLDAGPKVTYTEFKFNHWFFNRKWTGFKYGDIEFDELDGESKDLEVDLLRQRGSVK